MEVGRKAECQGLVKPTDSREKLYDFDWRCGSRGGRDTGGGGRGSGVIFLRQKLIIILKVTNKEIKMNITCNK
jgi:hypothetical protein